MQYWLKKEFEEKFARDSQKETEEERQSTSSLFSSRQILNRSIKKAERLLPLSPQKKVELRLPQIYHVHPADAHFGQFSKINFPNKC